MYPFSYTKAADIPTAIAAGGRYVAGGTTPVDLMRETVERPEALVDIAALPLRDITGVDTSAALAQPGVLTVISHLNAPRLPYVDNPGSNNPAGGTPLAARPDAAKVPLTTLNVPRAPLTTCSMPRRRPSRRPATARERR